MTFEGAGYSNKGISRESNQDSYLIKVAATPVGDVALVAVADGMGGLDEGELASATVIRMLSDWFDQRLPQALQAMGGSMAALERLVDGQWGGLLQDMNMALVRHGMATHANLGTTLTALLAVGGRYVVAHVGDTRAYELTSTGMTQLTEDQTYVHREVVAGRMTPEEAVDHPRRNVLLQCLGSTREVAPALVHGAVAPDATYLLCSDGLRHVVTDEELHRCLGPDALDEASWALERTRAAYARGTEADLARDDAEGFPEGSPSARLAETARLAMTRGEPDNITAVVLRTWQEGRR